tara:strand:- start:62 stop:865 length:804 start_codon:yes stop_codon:yes gene_type:complete
MKYTIFGSTGRIGSYLKKQIMLSGHSVYVPERKEYYSAHKNLGHVIYCSGVTSDFKTKCFDTIQSHVCLLSHLLQKTSFDSFNYISSSRLNFPKKNDNAEVRPNFYGEYEIDIYNASKLAGEALCIGSKIPNVKISRICHVVDPYDKRRENFLSDICGQAKNGEIKLNSSLKTKKNYILIDDLAFLLKVIGPYGTKNFYNIGSNNIISNTEIVKKLLKITNCKFALKKNAKTVQEKKIDISNLIKEFNYKPSKKSVWLESTLKTLAQ